MIQKWIRLQLKSFFKLNNLLSTNDFLCMKTITLMVINYNSRQIKFI